ncbi:hypothetical protein [Tsuneonella sp. SYSU-LHT278]|uniref:hypothetical protein n=1 Tax=Tsuneonella sediminis TaxID=3416089 RepID=UPI003F7A2DEC
MRRALILFAAIALPACQTTDSDDWTGGAHTPFGQAEKSCTELLQTTSKEQNRREFFVGCMGALGWTPKPAASIDL